VGGSNTFIFTDVVAPLDILALNILFISYLKRVGNPGIIDVPPDIKMLP